MFVSSHEAALYKQTVLFTEKSSVNMALWMQ